MACPRRMGDKYREKKVQTDTKLVKVADLVQQQIGRRLSPTGLWRWTVAGVRGARLRTVKIGGGLYSCQAWWAEFVARQNPESPPPPNNERATEAKLRAAGLL